MKAGWARRVVAAAVALAVLLLATGDLLLIRYDVGDPHASVGRMTDAPYSWIRGSHAWAATALVLVAILVLGRAWLLRSRVVEEPRAWLARLCFFSLLLASFLTGGMLAWDQQAWESWQHVESGANLVGAETAGDPEAAPRASIFLLHVVGIPALAVSAAAVMWWEAVRARIGTYVRSILADGWPVVPIVAALGVLLPPSLGPAPIPGIAVSRPEWPFLWLVPFQDWLGDLGIPVGLALVASILLAVPWLAKRMGDGARRYALLAFALLMLALSLRGAYA